MSKKSFAELLGEVSVTAQGGRRVADIVAALSPPPEGTGTSIAKADKPSVGGSVASLVPGLIGAGVGALAWSGHRALGAVAGHAVASTAVPILRGGAARKRALCQLGVEGAAIAGALVVKDHPILGFVGGFAAGVAVTAFIDGSPTRELWKRLTE